MTKKEEEGHREEEGGTPSINKQTQYLKNGKVTCLQTQPQCPQVVGPLAGSINFPDLSFITCKMEEMMAPSNTVSVKSLSSFRCPEKTSLRS